LTHQPGKSPVTDRQKFIVTEGEKKGPIHVIRISNVMTGEMEIEINGTPQKISFKTHGEKLPATPAAIPLTQMAARPQPQPEQQMSRGARIIMMEIERAQTKDLVDRGQYPPLPPTPLSPAQ
jgi:hypothetical protein